MYEKLGTEKPSKILQRIWQVEMTARVILKKLLKKSKQGHQCEKEEKKHIGM